MYPTKRYFITGIGTDVGKTVVSALITEKLQADYWKPIQSGDLGNSDSMKVKALLSNTKSIIHPESYRLNHALSPHQSADMDGQIIDLQHINLPYHQNNALVVEGAGGVMVPLNAEQTQLDLIKKLDLEVIVICKNYLGSINHTLLTAELLKQHQIKVKGLIFNGISQKYSESFILNYTQMPCLGSVPEMPKIDADEILKYIDCIDL